MQVDYEVAHQSVIDGSLRRSLPRLESGFITWITANDIQGAGVAEFDRGHRFQFAAEH